MDYFCLLDRYNDRPQIFLEKKETLSPGVFEFTRKAKICAMIWTWPAEHDKKLE
jgi:hypothetical protein